MLVANTSQSAMINSLRPAEPVQAIQPAISVRPGPSEANAFGPAYVRENSAGENAPFEVYGSDAHVVKALERRNFEVRQNEAAKGEALDDENFIYQRGPDGNYYAVGTGPHLVKRDNPPGPEGGSGEKGADGKELSKSDEELLQKLQARDAKVRSHEAAHVMAAGGQASSPTYEYQLGPDGKRYAIGGAVNISILSTGDSDADARQAGRAVRAALATGEPSSKDLQTAAKARNLMAKAMQKAAGKYAAMQAEG